MTAHPKTHTLRLTFPSSVNEEEKPAIGPAVLIDTQTGQRVTGMVLDVAPKKEKRDNQITKIIPYFSKQFNAIWLPLSEKYGRSKYLSIAAIYASMSITVLIGSFFVRGWQLGVIYNIARRMPVIAPSIEKLADVGKFIADGILLIFIKFLYDVPKILFLVVFGFELIEAGLDFLYWFIDFTFGDETKSYFGYLKENSLPEMKESFIWQLIIYLVYSTIVTPVFKIMSMKYAFSRRSAIFFNGKEIIDSLRVYYSRSRSTLAAYLWDLLVTGIGSLLTLFFLFIPVLGIFAAAFARFAFTHWPKSYGYGTLARIYIETRVLDPAKYATQK